MRHMSGVRARRARYLLFIERTTGAMLLCGMRSLLNARTLCTHNTHAIHSRVERTFLCATVCKCLDSKNKIPMGILHYGNGRGVGGVHINGGPRVIHQPNARYSRVRV